MFSGSVDNELPSTGVKCCGCGAFLQSHDRLKPGFVSREQMQLRKQSSDDVRCIVLLVIFPFFVIKLIVLQRSKKLLIAVFSLDV